MLHWSNEQFFKSHPNSFTFLKILIKLVQIDIHIKINSNINNISKYLKMYKIKIRLKETLKAIHNYKIKNERVMNM